MHVFELEPAGCPIEESRERVYGILETLLSHPDTGKWGRALNGDEQRRAIAAADALRAQALGLELPLQPGELPARELDLRFLIVDLCQPLAHLKADYERVICLKKPRPGCSPFALDHQQGLSESTMAARQAELGALYQSLGFVEDGNLPRRPDHVAWELAFMKWLIAQRRFSLRLAFADPTAGQQSERCDLAQRDFFGNHLTPWLVPFSTGLRKYTRGGYFEALGRFLAAWVPLERHHFGGVAGGSTEIPRGKRRRASLAK